MKTRSYNCYLIEDTRQQAGKHKLKHNWFEKMGIGLIRCKLPFGDYAKVYKVVVDTKKDMQEIAGNINSDHLRFKAECVLAQKAGCKLIVLVENEDNISSIDDVHKWENPLLAQYPNTITGARLEKAMKTMQERYGVSFEFCRPEESAKRITELLGLEVIECKTD